MKIKILIFLLCFSKLSFGQITHSRGVFPPFRSIIPFYKYNNNQDTIFFSNPASFNGFILTRCDIKLVDTIDVNKFGPKECLFIITCEGFINQHGGTFDYVEKLETTTYEIWDLNSKEKLFSANFSFNHQFQNYSTYGFYSFDTFSTIPRRTTHQYGYNEYKYNVCFESDKIIISNLKMEPTRVELDSANWRIHVVNNFKVDNEVGVYQFDGRQFIKQSPIETIRLIFEAYISSEETIDSDANKSLMTNSLKSITEFDTNSFELLINVWMYYDPTDYSCRDLVFNVLLKYRPESIKAIKLRINNKKEWETDNTAPYSDLKDLLKRLENE